MSETFSIGLGNDNPEIRKRSEEDFVSFWEEQAKKLTWFEPWQKTLELESSFCKMV